MIAGRGRAKQKPEKSARTEEAGVYAMDEFDGRYLKVALKASLADPGQNLFHKQGRDYKRHNMARTNRGPRRRGNVI